MAVLSHGDFIVTGYGLRLQCFVQLTGESVVCGLARRQETVVLSQEDRLFETLADEAFNGKPLTYGGLLQLFVVTTVFGDGVVLDTSLDRL